MTFKAVQEGKRTYQALAQADLRNGDLVKAMSVAAVVTTTEYESQLEVGSCALAADAVICAGICIGSTTSGNLATIALDGVYYMMAGGTIDVGNKAAVSLDPAAVIAATTTNAGSIIGTCLSSAGSTEQVMVALNI